MRSWIDQPHIAEILQATKRVVVACDNEDAAETQVETDLAHDRQVEKIQAVAPEAVVRLHHPPEAFKDLADQNETMGVAK